MESKPNRLFEGGMESLKTPKVYEAGMEFHDNRKRNMDRRRETSRFAARDRRAKESDIYDDLKDVVPLVEEPTITHVDRIAMLRVASTVCRFRKNVGNAILLAPDSSKLLRRSLQREVQDASYWSEDCLSGCLDGFILIADSDGVILYVTESVSIFLGLTQTDFAGRHLKDFIAQEDYKDYLAATQELTATSVDEDLKGSRACVLRFKTVISPRGRNLNLKSAIMKPVAFNIRVLVSNAGHCHLMQAITNPAGQGTISSSANALTKQGETQSGQFMTRHTCDMRLSYVSEQLHALLKTDSRSLMGASYYDLIHPADAERVRSSVAELLVKGHTRTPYYRLITGQGTVAWIMTEGQTVTHTTRGQKGQYIIGIHYVLGVQSEEECDRGATRGISAGLAVRIKQEPDDREYLTRQPEILDCIEFPSLLEDPGEFEPVPQRNRRVGAFGNNITNGFNAEHNDSAPSRKKSLEDQLQWFFRDQSEGNGEEEIESRKEGERGRMWREGGGRRDSFLGVQSGGAGAPIDALIDTPYRRATIGTTCEGIRGGGVIGGIIGRGGGSMLQSASLQSQHQPNYRRQQPVSSPQNALSSSFSRACDLSSPPQSTCGPHTTPATRSNSPITVASIERELRAEELCTSRPYEDGRIGHGIPANNSFTLPYSAGRSDARGYPASQDVLSALPPAGFSAATPLVYGSGRAPRVINNTSLVSSGYGSTANSCSPSSSSSTASTPMAPSIPIPSSSSLRPTPYGSLSSSSKMLGDDSFDMNAPFIDPCYDIPLGTGGLPQDLVSLLEIPDWVEPEELELPPRNARMNDYSSISQGGLFDDWNPSSFIDGRM